MEHAGRYLNNMSVILFSNCNEIKDISRGRATNNCVTPST